MFETLVSAAIETIASKLSCSTNLYKRFSLQRETIRRYKFIRSEITYMIYYINTILFYYYLYKIINYQ